MKERDGDITTRASGNGRAPSEPLVFSEELHCLKPREASIATACADVLLDPGPNLVPVAETSTISFVDSWLEHSPRFNRLGVRLGLYGFELLPLALGGRHRLRRLDEAGRAEFVRRMESIEFVPFSFLVKMFKGLFSISYYGDDRVVRRLGYDPDAVLERGRRIHESAGGL